jgi:predicted DNA-binding protein YlxM (UPF0122 family)
MKIKMTIILIIHLEIEFKLKMNKYDLIKEYQNGNNLAGTELLKKYKGFITIFVSLLYYGNYEIKNTSTKNFLKLLQTKNNQFNIEKLEDTIKAINNIYSTYDYIDALQDVQLSFLIAIKTFDITEYENRNNIEDPFDYFLSSYFPYILKKNTIDKLRNEPFPYTPGNEWSVKSITIEDNIFMTNIDDNWVNGDTCEEEFLDLSKDERELLKEKYIDNLTLKEIAQKRNKNKSTISRKLKQIKKTLIKNKKLKLENEFIIKEYLNNKSITDIGKKLNKSPMTIYRRLAKLKGG